MVRKLAFVLAAAACTSWAQLEVVATGLQGPQKTITTPSGSVIVSETSTAVNSGRISVDSASGSRRILIEGLPSGTDVTGGASGPTGLALRGNRLVAIGAGDTERRNEQGATWPNPQGLPLLCLLRSSFSN